MDFIHREIRGKRKLVCETLLKGQSILNSQKMKEEAKRDSTLRFSRLAICTMHALKNFQLWIKKERVKFSFWKWWANIEPKISLKEKLQYATFVLQNND
jgi:hypothetical protein